MFVLCDIRIQRSVPKRKDRKKQQIRKKETRVHRATSTSCHFPRPHPLFFLLLAPLHRCKTTKHEAGRVRWWRIPGPKVEVGFVPEAATHHQTLRRTRSTVGSAARASTQRPTLHHERNPRPTFASLRNTKHIMQRCKMGWLNATDDCQWRALLRYVCEREKTKFGKRKRKFFFPFFFSKASLKSNHINTPRTRLFLPPAYLSSLFLPFPLYFYPHRNTIYSNHLHPLNYKN